MAVHPLDADTLRFLEIHETRVHSMQGRRMCDLGDAVLLHDPIDREPFWNRVTAICWPDEGRAFDRRLDETITLFGALDRVPHVWPRPVLNEPADLVDRLLAAGFEDLGGGHLMVLDRPDPLSSASLLDRAGPDVSVERLRLVSAEAGERAATDAALVLAESFLVDPDRRRSLALETRAALETPTVEVVLARVGGEPAAVAKVTTFDGASYLSSIGTRPIHRRRGLGSIVTAVAALAATEAGSRLTYLGVYDGNETARRIYERLGFATLGVAPDLVLR